MDSQLLEEQRRAEEEKERKMREFKVCQCASAVLSLCVCECACDLCVHGPRWVGVRLLVFEEEGGMLHVACCLA